MRLALPFAATFVDNLNPLRDIDIDFAFGAGAPLAHAEHGGATYNLPVDFAFGAGADSLPRPFPLAFGDALFGDGLTVGGGPSFGDGPSFGGGLPFGDGLTFGRGGPDGGSTSGTGMSLMLEDFLKIDLGASASDVNVDALGVAGIDAGEVHVGDAMATNN